MMAAFFYIAIQALSSIAFGMAMKERGRFIIVVVSLAHVVLFLGLLIGYLMIARVGS